MREFTKEMLDKLTNANEAVKGTINYHWYHMASCFKSSVNGKWVFSGYYIPHKTGFIRKYKETLFIITENGERYELNDRVKELLGI